MALLTPLLYFAHPTRRHNPPHLAPQHTFQHYLRLGTRLLRLAWPIALPRLMLLYSLDFPFWEVPTLLYGTFTHSGRAFSSGCSHPPTHSLMVILENGPFSAATEIFTEPCTALELHKVKLSAKCCVEQLASFTDDRCGSRFLFFGTSPSGYRVSTAIHPTSSTRIAATATGLLNSRTELLADDTAAPSLRCARDTLASKTKTTTTTTSPHTTASAWLAEFIICAGRCLLPTSQRCYTQRTSFLLDKTREERAER